MKKLNKIFRTAEIASIDKYTIENEPISSIEFMERAAQIWTKSFLEKFGTVSGITIIAGPGNNGGDGYAIARLLRESGLLVKVNRFVTESPQSHDCAINYTAYIARGWEVTEIREMADFAPSKHDLIIDAIYGAGLNRPLTGLVAEIIRMINNLPNQVIAVDIPSGLMGEDNAGNDHSAIIQADYTFTFQFPKVAFMLAENAPYVGQWNVLNIGLHPDIMAEIPTNYYYLTENQIWKILPRTGKFDHKGTNGRALLVAGSGEMMGAAILAAKAAVRSGVGLLYCHVPKSGRRVINISVPEALLDTDSSDHLFSTVKEVTKYDAVAIGPAIGKNPETVEGMKKLLKEWRGVTILDADALNIISEHRELLELLHERCILTPHVKEFERLTGKCTNDFERLNKLSIFARQYKICIVLKGAHSVIAAPTGECYFNMSGNPGMAKGGTGDVLTGVLLALAANGLEPLQVAIVGVYAHGLAGDLAVEEVGERGLSAGILAEAMGKAWKKLESEGLYNKD